MKRNQSGFTLIEIAIVLVIIGLLLGGVLKGQELINSAKVKNLAADFKNTSLYIYSYQDKYKALPGDDVLANTHVTGAHRATGSGTTLGNGRIDGFWDDYPSAAIADDANPESFVFWEHVRLAGIATGVTVGTDLGYAPRNTQGGIIGITNATSTNNPVDPTKLKGAYIICSGGIQGKFAKQLDIMMDDGATNTGSMQTIPQAAATKTVGATPEANPDDATLYTVCMGV